MEIREEHRDLLRALGLKDEDFGLFDGRYVSYEFDRLKGVRLYDPYYMTSYKEYIDADGWSSWSSEQDTFMSDILKKAKEQTDQRAKASPKATHEEISQALRKKFEKRNSDH